MTDDRTLLDAQRELHAARMTIDKVRADLEALFNYLGVPFPDMMLPEIGEAAHRALERIEAYQREYEGRDGAHDDG